MKVIISTLILFITTFYGYSQNTLRDSLFSEAINDNIKTYKLAVNNAYINQDLKKGDVLFSDFVKNNLVNTYFDNFKAKNLHNAIIPINSYFTKPVMLVTYASWSIREHEEINTLNTLAKKYYDTIDFVVIFWDNKNTARKKAKAFNNKINVLYIDERENTFSSEIKSMKHSLGLSVVYYIDSKNRIIDIKKNNYSLLKANPTQSNGFTQNYNEFVDGLSTLLINGNLTEKHLVYD